MLADDEEESWDNWGDESPPTEADSADQLPIQSQVLLILNRKQRISIYQHLWMKIPMSGRLIMAG